MTIRSKLTRREFAAAAILGPASLALATTLARPARAATAAEINAGADAALGSFYGKVQGGKGFVNAARGVLIFPSIFQAGIGIGGRAPGAPDSFSPKRRHRLARCAPPCIPRVLRPSRRPLRGLLRMRAVFRGIKQAPSC